MTRLSRLQVEKFVKNFHSVPDDSMPVIVGMSKGSLMICLSNWGNAKIVFTKKLLTAIENKFGVHFEHIEPAEETVVMAKFSR